VILGAGDGLVVVILGAGDGLAPTFAGAGLGLTLGLGEGDADGMVTLVELSGFGDGEALAPDLGVLQGGGGVSQGFCGAGQVVVVVVVVVVSQPGSQGLVQHPLWRALAASAAACCTAPSCTVQVAARHSMQHGTACMHSTTFQHTGSILQAAAQHIMLPRCAALQAGRRIHSRHAEGEVVAGRGLCDPQLAVVAGGTAHHDHRLEGGTAGGHRRAAGCQRMAGTAGSGTAEWYS
jgi:hypothetical protein